MNLSLGFSPCPNDCFIFYALVHGRVWPEASWDLIIEDIEALNQKARAGKLDVSKISYHACAYLLNDYVVLRSGGVLGKGVGPLIVSRENLDSLQGRRVAVPGGLTTANLLLRLSQPRHLETIELRYDEIMPAVARGEVDAGLIIHESRFTYPDYGLLRFQDLGEWWERETGLPLPLGGIVAKRALGETTLKRIERALRESLTYAYEHRGELEPFIARYAQEMSEEVRQKHIDLYVNAYSFDLGEDGESAVGELMARAEARGLVPHPQENLFLAR